MGEFVGSFSKEDEEMLKESQISAAAVPDQSLEKSNRKVLDRLMKDNDRLRIENQKLMQEHQTIKTQEKATKRTITSLHTVLQERQETTSKLLTHNKLFEKLVQESNDSNLMAALNQVNNKMDKLSTEMKVHEVQLKFVDDLKFKFNE